jgi:beta-galactosidase/beta-glucuronidase
VVPRPEYPRPALRRRDWVNLNGEWRFALGDDPAGFEGRIVVPFAPQAELSRVMDRRLHDVAWYMRTFDAPPAGRLLLHFGAVDYRATVWVNGTQVAEHEGGHTPFSADLTGAVREHANELVVRAEDPATDLTIPRGKQYWKERGESIFYTPTTGIWQTVWLEPLPAMHIESLRLLPDLATGALEFEVAAGAGPVELEVTLDGRLAGRWRGDPGGGRIALDPVVTWSPQRPVLYEVLARLPESGDLVAGYFGLRTVETRDGRFLLNGEPYVQRLVLDQGYFPGGLLTAATDDDLRRDIEAAKALGFNGARKHQKLEDPRWLYWADWLGFLVWAEMPSFQQHSAAAERRLAAEWAEAVRRDRDHPSVVAWVPMNESFGIRPTPDDATRSRFLVELYRLTHELDGTRPVSGDDGWEHALTDLLTLHDYGPPTDLAARYRDLASTLEPSGRPYPPYLPGFEYRGEPVILSEFGGIAFAERGWGYSAVRSPEDFLRTYGGMVEALMQPGPVEGFCYTQLTDVEQEQNGLLTFDRRPKVDPARLRSLTQTPKQRD